MRIQSLGFKKRLLFLFIMINLCSSMWAEGNSWVNTDYNTTEGTDFWLTNMFNGGNTNLDTTDVKLRLFAVARQQATVTIHYLHDDSQETFVVNANSKTVHPINLQKGYVYTENTVLQKGIHITSSSPISIYCVNQNSVVGSQDATCILPTSALGKEYVVQTYSSDNYSTEFTLVTTQPTNNVSINVIRRNETNPALDSTYVINIGPMQPGSVYLHRSNGALFSLSGTTICSDAPIAVFAGGQAAIIPNGYSNENHLYSQLSPISLWGKQFVITNTYGTYIDYVRFSSAESNNSLQVLGANNLYSVATTDIGAMGTYTDSIELLTAPFSPKANVYKTDRLTESFLYLSVYFKSQSQSNDVQQLGAPAMTPITPMEYGMRSVIFPTLQAPNIQNHYVNIVTYQTTKNYMQLDGVSIGSQFQDIPGTPYSFCEILLDTTISAHILQNNRRDRLDGVFTARVYGLGKQGIYRRRESYAYSAGARVCSSADMLIDDAYIKSKTICLNDSVKFTSIINYDYSSIEWQFGDSTSSTDSIAYKRWNEAGLYPIKMIVGRTLPPCNYTYYDTVKATINVKDEFNALANKLLCSGSSDTISGLNEDSVWQSVIFTQDVDTFLHFYTTSGCDSIVNVQLRFGVPDLDTIPKTECDSFTWHDSVYYESGTYEWKTSNIYGCDSTEILQLAILHSVIAPTERKIIYSDSLPYLWNGKSYPTPGLYVDTLKTIYGCDSIVSLLLQAGSSWRNDEIVDICEPDLPYEWRGNKLYQQGMYYDSLTTFLGFDSIYSLQLNVHSIDSFEIDTIICERELPYNHPDSRATRLQNLSEAGTYYDTLQTIHNCDSVITLHLTVHPTTYNDTTVVWCASKGPYYYGDHERSATESGVYIDTLNTLNSNGCDSVLVLHLQVISSSTINLFDTICSNKLPYNFNNPAAIHLQGLTQNGVYYDTLHTALDCDSILALHLFVAPSYEHQEETIHLCEGDTMLWNGLVLDGRNGPVDSLIIHPMQTIFGCDSIIYLNWHVHPVKSTVIDTFICERELPYNHPDSGATRLQNLSETGTYYDTLQTIHNCDSVITLHLMVNPTTYNDTTVVWCASKGPYYYGDHERSATESGDYIDTLNTLNSNGCDSVLVLHLQVISSSTINLFDTICSNKLPYNFNNPAAIHLQGLTQNGVYYDTLHTALDCDSILALHLFVAPSYEHQEETIHLCEGDTMLWNGLVLDGRNGPVDSLIIHPMQTILGCDSIIYLNWHVHPVKSTVIDTIICERELPYNHPDSGAIRLQNLSETGTYYDTLQTIHNCDSVITLHLTVHPTTHYYDTVTTCRSAGPYPYGDHGNTATASGDYVEVLQTRNQFGCDSVYHLHLIVLETIVDSQVVDWCDNAGPYYFPDSRATNLQGLVTSDIYRDTLKSINDCDSIIVLDFRVHSHSEKTIRENRCDNELPYIDPNTGIQYWRDTTIIDTLENAVHCDSILTINLYVHPTYYEDKYDTICEMDLPYNYADARATRLLNLYATGVYRDTLRTIHNCDSVIVLHLTVHPTTHYYDTVTTCRSAGPYPYGDHGNTATESGDYVEVLQTRNRFGCDSVYHLHLIVLETIVDSQVVDWCDNAGPYYFPDSRATNLQGLVTSDIYRDTLKSIDDCDSIIVLDFRVHSHSEKSIRENRCDNELPYIDPNTGIQYWRDTTIIDTLVNAANCDSILTINLYVHPTYYEDKYDTICEMDLPYNYADSGATRLQNLSETGTYYDTLQTIHNCDSVIALHLMVHPTTYKDTNVVWCESAGPYTYGENGKTAFEDGEYRDTLQTRNMYGCDSVLIVHLQILRTQTTLLKDTLCSNYLPYNYSNPAATRLQGLTQTGVFFDTLQTDQGCDSILELHLFIPPAYEHQEETIHLCEGDTMLWNGMLLDGRNGPLDSLIVHPMQTIYGCDSIIYLDWHVHPTYLLVTDTSICQFDTVVWQGKKYWATGEYYDSLKTNIWECDSIYKLKLYVKPTYKFHKSLTVCSNDTLWYPDNVLREQIIWRPGYPIDMDYITLDFHTKEGCDSSYIYHLTINKAYSFESSAAICSNMPYEETYYQADGTSVSHLWPGLSMEFDQVDTTVIPFDTLFRDAYQTVNDCDSVFMLHATVFPSYRHVEYDTICQNDTLVWREKQLCNFEYGDVIIRDTLLTKENGCDSIFELHLCVHPTYFFELNETICEGDQYILNGKVFTTIADSKPHLFKDSLLTLEGCDSVYYLYLTTLPILRDTIRDTICYGEVYRYNSLSIDSPGYYIDTAITSWGCYKFTDLFIEFIEPTRFILHLDTICADDSEIAVYFDYIGRKPIGYSAFFEIEGLQQHFVDISSDIDSVEVLSNDSGSGVFYIPIWRGDELPHPQHPYYDTNNQTFSTDSKYAFVRPDDYRIRIFFDNGICQDNSRMMVDTIFHVMYPDWIIEQHWNDAIVIYNEQYNGGYNWTSYQWYKDGQPILGQDTAYFYDPQELDFGHEYQVLLTRLDDGKSILTCPIIPHHIADTITPTSYYLSVVPTLVSSSNPVVNIMHTENCWYRLSSLEGIYFDSGFCEKNDLNATEIVLPPMPIGTVLLMHMYFEDYSYKRIQKIIYKK